MRVVVPSQTREVKRSDRPRSGSEWLCPTRAPLRRDISPSGIFKTCWSVNSLVRLSPQRAPTNALKPEQGCNEYLQGLLISIRELIANHGRSLQTLAGAACVGQRQALATRDVEGRVDTSKPELVAQSALASVGLLRSLMICTDPDALSGIGIFLCNHLNPTYYDHTTCLLSATFRI